MKPITVPDLFLYNGQQPGREKIVMGLRKSGEHCTFMVHGITQMFDIHKTVELPGGEKSYESILKIPVNDLKEVLEACLPEFEELARRLWLSSRINLGKLHRHGLILQPLPQEESQYPSYVKVSANGRRVRFEGTLDADDLEQLLIFPEELPESPHELFFLYRVRGNRWSREGLLFKYPLDLRQRSFFFVSSKRLSAYFNGVGKIITSHLRPLEFPGKEKLLS